MSTAAKRHFGTAMRSLGRSLCIAASLCVLQGCVYLPRTILLPDRECQGLQKQMILEGTQVAAIQGCINEGCAVLVAAAGIVTATTVIVSGSIVIVGNVVYWIERQANCQPRS